MDFSFHERWIAVCIALRWITIEYCYCASRISQREWCPTQMVVNGKDRNVRNVIQTLIKITLTFEWNICDFSVEHNLNRSVRRTILRGRISTRVTKPGGIDVNGLTEWSGKKTVLSWTDNWNPSPEKSRWKPQPSDLFLRPKWRRSCFVFCPGFVTKLLNGRIMKESIKYLPVPKTFSRCVSYSDISIKIWMIKIYLLFLNSFHTVWFWAFNVEHKFKSLNML